MPWRVLQSGPMIEVVTGHLNNQESTTTRVANAGEIIKGDLSQSLRDRFEANDPYVRSIVEYGEIETGTDDDGNPTETFVVSGGPVEESDPIVASDEETQQRIDDLQAELKTANENLQAAEQANADLQTQLNEANQAHEQTRGELAEAKQQAEEGGGGLSYGDLSKEALEAEAKANDIEVTRADGKGGDPLKSDYVRVLEERAAQG